MSSRAGPNPENNMLYYLLKLIARQSAVYGFFDVLGRATSMILVPLYASRLDTRQFGTMEILLVSQSLLVGLLVLGLNSALVRYHQTTTTDRERAEYFRTGFTIVLTVTGVVTAILMALAAGISRLTLGTADYSGLWRLVFLTVFSDAMLQMFLALFRSQEKPFRYSWVNTTRFMSTLLLNIVLVGFLGYGVTGAIIGNLAGTVLGLTLGAWFSRGIIGLEIHRERLGPLWLFGFSIMVHPLAMFVVNNSDRFLLKMYHGVGEVGVYALGYKVGLILSLVVNAFLVSWQPLVYRIGREEGAEAIYSRVLTYYLIAGSLLVVAIASFSHEIIGLISDPSYSRAAGFIWLILVSYLLQGIYYIFSAGILVTDRVHWYSIVVVIGAATSLSLNLLLIPRLGIWGAATSSFLSYVTLAAFMYVIAQRRYRIRYEFRRVGLLIAAGAGVLLVNDVVIGHGSWPKAVVKLLLIMAFPVALHILRFFSKEELERGAMLVRRLAAAARGG